MNRIPSGPGQSRVLIAGAGPVGLAAALRLAQLGVGVSVLERRTELCRRSRASTWLPATLEVLEQLGVVEGALRTGCRADRIRYVCLGAAAPLAEFDLGVLAEDTRYPFRLHLDQSEVTLAMAARLAAYPHARLSFDSEVVGIAEDGEGVAVRVRSALGERVERGAFLLGADGAGSTVREMLGIRFDGQDYAQRVLRLLTTADLRTLVPGLAPVTYLFGPAGSCSLLRLPEMWRIVCRVPGAEGEAALEEARIRRRLAAFLPGADTLPLVSKECYPVSRRVADRYGRGRVVLAGDAAHVTNARGGMNMNCGVHDAMAAAQALADALAAPEAAAERLADYAEARREVALDLLLPRTHRTVAGGEAWLETIAAIAADPVRTREYLRSSAMLDMAAFRASAAPFGLPA